ncbi:MAG TPA: ATP-binding cassette domain-containing protein, partial [Puia sp.]|nr:ATP-binding cassette domain-containing protein [Puia sp.]
MAEKFLELSNVTVKSAAVAVLENIDIVFHRGEQWVITGSSGSGKTLLAHTLAGKYFYSGKIEYFFPLKNNNKSTIGLVEEQHRFKNLSNTHDLYYQQRFNSSDAELTITVEQELMEYGLDKDFVTSKWLDDLHVRGLLQKPLIQLSNGENKRTQIAIALLQNPELLILDSPFTGLDAEGRETLHQIIKKIKGKGIHVLLIASPHEIPEITTHIVHLEKGKICFAGRKENFHLAQPAHQESKLDSVVMSQLKPQQEDDFNFAIRMINVNVEYSDKKILRDINWEVKKGEGWNVSGPNGAGKSTLLSLVTADNPQAYANEIYLFDKRRGSGESIWDVKKKIGFVSPELHVYF